MKAIIFLICFLSAFISTIYAQWAVQETSFSKTLYCVYFADENNGWICGDATIMRTSNGGLDWSATGNLNRLGHVLYSIAFADNDSGYACGVKIIPDFDPSLTIYLPSYAKTCNCGETWEFPSAWGNTQGRWKSVCFVNNTTGWLAGYTGSAGKIYKTTSGINNFTFQAQFPKAIYSSCFIDENIGWVCGKDGYMSRTSDGGESWTDQNTGTQLDLNSVKFTDAHNGFAAGYKYISGSLEGVVLSTSDGGENWIVLNLPGRLLNTVFAIDKNTAWLGGSIQTSGGNKGIIYYTSDGGVNWEPQYTSETSTSIYSIHFINASIGWAVGSGGEIIKTTTGGVTSIYDGTEELNSFRLLQNYPNPFNPNTKINYSIPKTCFVTLKVYDLLGKEVLYLVNEEKPEGYYEVEFNGALLSSGVYLYSIQAGNFSDTKKFILLR